MKIRRARFYRYKLPLTRPLELRNVTITERLGLIVGLEANGGAVAYGECAPLPAFSFESTDRAHEGLIRITEYLRKEGFDYEKAPYGLRPWERAMPSIRFGIETAILQLQAAQRGTSLIGMLGVPARDAVLVNGLLTGPRDRLMNDAKEYARSGYRVVKLKVGRGTMDDDIELVYAVRDAIGPTIALRLDANQAWLYQDAVRFACAIDACHVEYIEEPLRDAAYLSRWFHETGVLYAIDETLTQIGWLRILQWLRQGALARDAEAAPSQLAATVRDAAAWVIKPTLAGLPPLGLFRDLAEGAAPADLVISGSFESGVGVAALAAFAACLGGADVAAGLDTYSWLARDIIEPPLRWQNGTMQVSEAVAALSRFTPDKLEELRDPRDG